MIDFDVLIADASQARFFRYSAPPAELRLLDHLTCPEARRHEQELVSSRPGRMVNRLLGHTVSLAARHRARDAQLDRFARRIARKLGASGRQGPSAPLVLICGARLLGLVSSHLSIRSRRRVVATLSKDLLQSSHADLTERVTHLVRRVESPAAPAPIAGSTSLTIRARRHRAGTPH